MDYTGIEAWACRLWILIALAVVVILSVFSMHYYDRQHAYYNEQRELNKLCCAEILVTSLTRELHCTTISCSYGIIKDVADGNYCPELQRPLLQMYVLKVKGMEGVNFDE